MRRCQLTLIENPELYPAWLVQFSASEEAEHLRGKQVFEMMREEVGVRVQFMGSRGGEEGLIHKPWTYFYVPVPIVDFTEQRKELDRAPCSVIMDCHFPIMKMENAYTAEPDQMFELIESREVMIKNLSLADVVTVPHPAWAADLAEVNPHVFVLPDVDNDSEELCIKFITRINEIGMMSYRNRQARKCSCDECQVPSP